MNKGLTFISGLGLGASMMYALDPAWGRRRRSVMRDRIVRELHETEKAVAVGSTDLRHRVRGLAAEASSRLSREAVDDDVLVARVRSKIGRVVSHPGALEIEARDGRVTLAGPILADEVDELLACAASVRGVRSVESRLDVRTDAADEPGLQGDGRRGGRYSFFQMEGSPAAWLLTSGAGGGLLAWGMLRRGLVGKALGGIGIGLIARALGNLPTRQSGEAARNRMFEVHKSVHIAAPVEELFGFLTRFENLPRFMSHLREVRSLGERRWRWVAEGPLGAPVEWDAIVTDLIDGRLIGWRSAPGSVVQNGGRVRFIPSEDGGTRLEIELFYRPPGGLLGRIVAALAGADPKRALDEDLVRLKSLFEQGKTRVHGERVTREQLLRGEPGKPRDPLVH